MKVEQPVPVFIVHWNRPAECVRAVRCFLEQSLPVSISIVDNASEPENYQALRERLPAGVELIRLDENKGWGGGLNVLLRRWLEEKTEGQRFCFISAHDALPQDECLKMLMESAQGDTRLGIACPEYGSPRDLPRYSPVRGPRLLPSPPRQRGSVEPVDFAHATLFVISKDCLREIGLFDERYFAYGDEYDIALKARRMGWRVAVVWGAIVVNPISGTSKAAVSYLFARNTLLLALTYGGRGAALTRMALMFLNTVRLSLRRLIKKRDDFYPAAKLRGMRDFLLRRYGPPPFNSR